MTKIVQRSAFKFILYYRKSTDVWTIEGGAYTIEESSSTANDDIIYERTDKEECFYSEVNHAFKKYSTILKFLQLWWWNAKQIKWWIPENKNDDFLAFTLVI